MDSSNSEYTVLASAPFNTDFADIVLRTPDKVDFNVHSQILRLTSTVFDGIVSIPPPPAPDGVQSSPRPIIDVTEDSATLDCLLRSCYPTTKPVCTDVELLDRILAAAHKYDFELATAWATSSLEQIVEAEPLAVYTVACVHSLEDLARKAAIVWKGYRSVWTDAAMHFDDTPAGASYIPFMDKRLYAGPYLRLLQYLRGHLVSCFCQAKRSPRIDIDALDNTLKQYPFNAGSADTIFCSSEGHHFRVHRTIIEQQLHTKDDPRTIWTVFKRSPDDLHEDGLPVVQTSLRWDVLSTLLKLCYTALEESNIITWDVKKATSPVIIGALSAATAHHFDSLVRTYRTRLLQLVSQDPLAIFCIFAQFDWGKGMLEAARELALRSPSALCSHILDQESLPAKTYQALLKHYHECQRKLFQRYLTCRAEAISVSSERSQGPSRFPSPFSHIPYQTSRILDSSPPRLSTPQPPEQNPPQNQSTMDSLDFAAAYGGMLSPKNSVAQTIIEVDYALRKGSSYELDTERLLRQNEKYEGGCRLSIASVKLLL